ncbi:MAG: exo-alpha-sialidase [Bryobacterales bacterium]|nr:exo-alpha-sialidase [Bryobacterales bacterium]
MWIQLGMALAVGIIPEAADVAYRQPRVAVDGSRVAVAFGTGDTVRVAVSNDQGKTFSHPVQVFPAPGESGKLALGRHRGPRIAMSGKTLVISAIVGAQGGGRDGDVVAWRSTDGGKTWSRGVRVNDVEGAAREGLHAMGGEGNTLLNVWLDLRQKGTRLYGSVSKDGGATWAANKLIYESPDQHICECCHPMVHASSGALHVMWRNWLSGSRDMYTATSADGGLTFGKASKLGTGTWPLNACPMDGGGLAADTNGQLWSAWRRENNVILAGPDGKEHDLGKGKDPAIARLRDGVVVAWTLDGVRIVRKGSPPEVLDAAGAYVDLAAGRDFVIAAWESGKTIQIARVE